MAQLGERASPEGAGVPDGTEVKLVRIEREMNDHRAMTVRVVQSGELRTLVDYESPRLRERLARLRAGEKVPLKLAPAPGRGNAWVALDV